MNYNVLMTGFNETTYQVINKISDKKYIKSINLVINNDKYLKNISNNKKLKNVLNTRNCQLGVYPTIEQKLELDNDLLNKLSFEQTILLKMMERFQFNKGLSFYDNRIYKVHIHLRFWLNFLINNKIDYLIFSQIPHVIFDYAAYSIANYLNIKCVMFYRLPIIPNRNVSIYSINNIKNHSSKFINYYNNIQKESLFEIDDRIKSYYEFQKNDKNSRFIGKVKSNKNLKKYFKFSNYYNHINYQINFYKDVIKLWSNPKDLLSRLSYYFSVDTYKPDFIKSPNLKKKFIFFPMHYQPECSTCPLGDNFVFQELAIKMLLNILPSNFNIYIKPHPRVGSKLKNNYKSIINNPKIIFIHSDINSYELIKNSYAVATVTGTAGLEAFLNKKNVLVFGNTFYDKAPGIFKINSTSDLKLAFEKILKKHVIISDDIIKNFLKSMEVNSFEGWVDNRYSSFSSLDENENANNIIKEIEKVILKSYE